MVQLLKPSSTELNIVGPQFDQDAVDAKLIQHNFIGTNEEIVYTTPTGKTFFCTKIMFINASGVTEKWRMLVDDKLFYVISLVTRTVHEINFNQPVPFISGTVLKIDADSSSNSFVMIGTEK